MNLVYTLLIPFLIVLINYWVTKDKPKKVSDYVNILAKSLPDQYGYLFFLYYLSRERNLDVGWAPITITTFLLTLTVIIISFKIFYFIKKRQPIKSVDITSVD